MQFEGVTKEAKSVESALTQLRQDTDKKVQQALAAIQKPVRPHRFLQKEEEPQYRHR
jgi:hypothetical protein